MKTAFLGVLIILASSLAAAHGGTHLGLPEPGTTPDSLWYGLDTALDKVSLALTFNEEAKAEKRLEIARERLSEARTMAQKNNTGAAATALQEFHAQMEKSRETASRLESGNLSAEINQTYRNNKQVLSALVEIVPGEASKGVRKALEASSKIGMRQVPVGRPDGESGFIASGMIDSR